MAELRYQALRWATGRRLIVVREELTRRPAARGRELFHAPGYRFHAVVTTLAVAYEEVWRTGQAKPIYRTSGFSTGARNE